MQKKTDAAPSNINRKVILKDCAPFANCLSRINTMQVDYASYSDVKCQCII